METQIVNDDAYLNAVEENEGRDVVGFSGTRLEMHPKVNSELGLEQMFSRRLSPEQILCLFRFDVDSSGRDIGQDFRPHLRVI